MTTELRTWAAPDEPKGVEGVRDSDGDLWRPCSKGGWQNCGNGNNEWHRDLSELGDIWLEVLRYAPLREVRQQSEMIGPIKITDAMVDAASAELGVEMNAEVLAAALRAGGFAVAE